MSKNSDRLLWSDLIVSDINLIDLRGGNFLIMIIFPQLVELSQMMRSLVGINKFLAELGFWQLNFIFLLCLIFGLMLMANVDILRLAKLLLMLIFYKLMILAYL
jgi:hypothetical protein